MNKINMQIDASPSKYWCSLQFEDREGMVHEKKIENERIATINSNRIQAAIDGFHALIRPCMVDLYSSDDYITAPFTQGWMKTWEENGFKNAKGTEVKNAEQWKDLKRAMAPHSVRFIKQGERR